MKVKVTNLKLTLEQVANGTAVTCIGVRAIKEFIDGKSTDKTVAFAYDVVAQSAKYVDFTIKVPIEHEKHPAFTQEDIENNGGEIMIQPIGFIGKFWKNSKINDYEFTATATSAKVMISE